jgi:hypothetical protein
MSVESLAEKLFFTTVRIDTLDSKGQASVGTAFSFAYSVTPTRTVPFLVTARHVVEDVAKGWLTFNAGANGSPELGAPITIEISDFDRMWRFHPERQIDIAVTPLAPWLRRFQEAKAGDVFLRPLHPGMIPTAEQAKEIDAIEEVLFIGYPKGFWDTTNCLPIVRRGITASPFGVDFDGQRQFLIDAPVYPGSSGSPVVLWNPGGFPMKSGGWSVGSRCFLLGVLAKGIYGRETSILEVDKDTSYPLHSKPMIGLGLVFRADLVPEMISQAYGDVVADARREESGES